MHCDNQNEIFFSKEPGVSCKDQTHRYEILQDIYIKREGERILFFRKGVSNERKQANFISLGCRVLFVLEDFKSETKKKLFEGRGY